MAEKETAKALREYWEKRGQKVFEYKNEQFYTITALPQYARRRDWLMRNLQSTLSGRILDFGCGDGMYSALVKKACPSCTVKGCDLSHSMIELAKENAKEQNLHIEYVCSDSKIPFSDTFDCIISVVVLQHILDEDVLDGIISDMYSHLAKGGKAIVFEACAKTQKQAKFAVRRTAEAYIRQFQKHSFRLHTLQSYSTPFYDILDLGVRAVYRPVATLLNKATNTNKYHNLNAFSSFVTLSEWNIALTKRLDAKTKRKRCYNYFVFEKC